MTMTDDNDDDDDQDDRDEDNPQVMSHELLQLFGSRDGTRRAALAALRRSWHVLLFAFASPPRANV